MPVRGPWRRSYYLHRNFERARWGYRPWFTQHHPSSLPLCEAWTCVSLAEFSAFRARTQRHPRMVVNFCRSHTQRIFAGQRDGRWHVYPIDDESRHLAAG